MLAAASIIGCWLTLIKPVFGLSRSWIKRITAGDQHRHEVDRQPLPPRLQPAGITVKPLAMMATPYSAIKTDIRYSVTCRCQTLFLVVDHFVQRLDEESRRHHPVILRRHGLGLLPERLLKRVRASNRSILLRRRRDTLSDIKPNLHVLPQQSQCFCVVRRRQQARAKRCRANRILFHGAHQG